MLGDVELNISMVNLPTALDTQVIKVQYHIEVIHTLPMQATVA